MQPYVDQIAKSVGMAQKCSGISNAGDIPQLSLHHS